jgi:pyruvate/2-oxoglutarate/acetoin dehydrogenase E1 component
MLVLELEFNFNMLNTIYNDNIKEAMSWLAEQTNTIFLGQAVCYAGTGLYDSLSHLPQEKRIEFPVAENFQVGYSIGLALNGFVPISTFPRWNFLLCATDQIVNHLDKLEMMSDGGYKPKVIIRVASGSKTPVNPQQQHVGDFSDAFKSMCTNINIIQLVHHENILDSYKKAWDDTKSSILVEYPDYGKL